MSKAKILGTGLYAPGKPIDNAELQQLAGIQFEADKIEAKIGIKARCNAKLRGLDETTADFGERAVRAAIEDAGIDAAEIGLFIAAGDTPEFVSPSTAVLIQGRIQGGPAGAMVFDMNSSCASFAMAFDVAARILATNPAIKYAAIVGIYNMPAFLRPDDTFGYTIFADGAGAFILGRTEDDDVSGYITGHQFADGTQWDYIGVYTGGSRNQPTHELIDNKKYGLENLKPLPGSRNVKLWPPIVEQLAAKAGMTAKDIDHPIFTQINLSVIEQVMEILGKPMSETTTIMDRYGYTGSGCLPMAFHIAVKEGRVKRGDKVCFVGSGSGLTVGTNLFTY